MARGGAGAWTLRRKSGRAAILEKVCEAWKSTRRHWPRLSRAGKHPSRTLVSLPRANPSVRPPPPFPPHDEPAPMAAHQGKLIGKHQQSKRYHPETQNWQEAKNAAEDQHGADRDPEAARARHGDLTAEDRYFPCRWMIVACCAHVWLAVRSGKVKTPPDESRNRVLGSALPARRLI